ncbi:MAG: hypothetical protein FWG98_11175 [Candidatus Cloacimonetes bacterium]|nr:hypothetical protein [Candidatus Cloacimonadota bacterium]
MEKTKYIYNINSSLRASFTGGYSNVYIFFEDRYQYDAFGEIYDSNYRGVINLEIHSIGYEIAIGYDIPIGNIGFLLGCRFYSSNNSVIGKPKGKYKITADGATHGSTGSFDSPTLRTSSLGLFAKIRY